MDKLQWIKDLVLAEQQMEDSGVIDFSAGFDPEKELEEQSIEYLRDLKAAFIESSNVFNQLKGSSLGNLKIYGISKTKADFMLFRNGYKLIFSLKRPGEIVVSINHIGAAFIPGSTNANAVSAPSESISIKARWGAFGDLDWTYKDQPVRIDFLVRYYLSRFVKESTK